MLHDRHFESEEFEEELTPRDGARKNLWRRRRLQDGLVAMVVVSTFLIVAWAASGAGYFWPGWVMAAFVLVMVLRYMRYQRGPITEEQINEETRRMRSGR